MKFTTEPDGARLSLDLRKTCYTPCTLTPPRNHVPRLMITKEGYETRDEPFKRSFAKSFWFNMGWFILGPAGVLIGGGGMLLDWTYDTMWRYKEPLYHYVLKPIEEDEEPAPEETEQAAEEEPEQAEQEEEEQEEPPPPPRFDATPVKPKKPRDDAPAVPDSPKKPAPKVPKKPRAPAPKPDDSDPRRFGLPDSPAYRSLLQAVPVDEMDQQILNYYGDLEAPAKQRVLRRLYRILNEMERAGERLDVDEAVRRERFR